jgi:L-aminopeptidase/D-esterase-like protein
MLRVYEGEGDGGTADRQTGVSVVLPEFGAAVKVNVAAVWLREQTEKSEK